MNYNNSSYCWRTSYPTKSQRLQDKSWEDLCLVVTASFLGNLSKVINGLWLNSINVVILLNRAFSFYFSARSLWSFIAMDNFEATYGPYGWLSSYICYSSGGKHSWRFGSRICGSFFFSLLSSCTQVIMKKSSSYAFFHSKRVIGRNNDVFT